MTSQQRLAGYIVIALIIDYIPIINLPFLWSETFFHEISHGMAAIISGGVIETIQLNFNGSGVCSSQGGWRFLISFSGYAGSALWGFVLYRLTETLSMAKTKLLVGLLLCMTGGTLVFFARDISTIMILIILLLLYLLPLYKSLWFNVKFIIQLVAVFVMLDALRSPLYLLGRAEPSTISDSAALAQLTWLPEIIWILLWLGLSASCLYFSWRLSRKYN